MMKSIYTCSHHSEIKQDRPGDCPKCGMKLMKEITRSKIQETNKNTSLKDYTSLIVVVGIILATAIVLSWKDAQLVQFSLKKSISYFMIGFFLVFSSFKLMDIRGFAEGYHAYDLLAKKVFSYGYFYPFVELFFGLAMILIPTSKALLWTEFGVMTFSGIGVVLKLARHEKFQCVCLGTFIKVPLTNITLIEDFGMATLALLMLYLR